MTNPLQTAADPRNYPGIFLSFEGGEAVGKTTQIALLRKRCEAFGRPITVTREPGGTEMGKQLRRLIQHDVDDLNPRAEVLMYAADRSYHVATKVRPALEAGGIVLTDRYLDSSIAYQGGARGLGDAVEAISLWATEGLLPDLTILLDADPDVLFSRRGEATDRLERESREFHLMVRERFLSLAEERPERFVVVDAAQSVEAIEQQVWAHVRQLCESRFGPLPDRVN
ncbi:dTMP kinase [Boudabousia marimammalium]|uniref:Thymidylate kinase n=1 Tax=Boudabousia marimammalium TaxID=156892 RepID=A0A1Q5PMB1_9ACTO|nr:dTMP kinase [Boudabousia marimammalium]OKL48659.1 dTMP kinase [Boudabousia marimammalium]